MPYVPSRIAAKALGVHANTLRKYANKGLINYIRTPAGQRKYDLEGYLNKNIVVKTGELPVKQKKTLVKQKKNYCYCRVSSKKQEEDLIRQINSLRIIYPDHEIISDYGSGISFKRTGLKTILEQSNKGLVGDVVVAYRDRLARIAFELVEFFIKINGGKIVVLNAEPISQQEEFAEDLFSIIHVFSSRHYGSRKYKNKTKRENEPHDNQGNQSENLPKEVDSSDENKAQSGSEEEVETMV